MADANTPDGLWRWLVGGLVAGLAILGLLIAAYEIGHHRGQDSSRAGSPARPPATTQAAPTTQTASTPAIGTVPTSAALVSRGKSLFSADSCAGCHSLSGAAGAGPSIKGLAGSTVTLADGTTVVADDAYLARSITDPDAQISKGYNAGIMSAAIASLELGSKPDDVRALIAFVKAQGR